MSHQPGWAERDLLRAVPQICICNRFAGCLKDVLIQFTTRSLNTTQDLIFNAHQMRHFYTSTMQWICLIAVSWVQHNGSFGVKIKCYLSSSLSLRYAAITYWIRTFSFVYGITLFRHVGAPPLHYFKMAAKNGAVVSFVYSWDALLCSSLINWTQPPRGSGSTIQHHYDGNPEQIHFSFRCQRVVMEKRYLYTVSE